MASAIFCQSERRSLRLKIGSKFLINGSVTLLVGLALLTLVLLERGSPETRPRALDRIRLAAPVTTSFDAFRANSQPATMQFGGKIDAETTGCLQNRVIQIFRVSGGSVPDVLATTTSTTGFAQGQFSTAGHPKVPGTYYAVAPQQDDLANGDTCLEAISGTEEVT